MRIISGIYRGRKIKSPTGNNIRPTSDRIKENVFNIIQTKISGGVFLDIFSGTGGMGIEALSRGAERVIFNDFFKESINLISENIAQLGCENYLIFNQDYNSLLSKLDSQSVDIIYADPPFKHNDILNNITNKCYNVLKKDGLLLVEHDSYLTIPYNNENYDVSVRKYGSTSISIFQKK